MVQISTFDGGLATRVDPSLLQFNQAQALVNADPDSVVLKSAKDWVSINEPAGDTIYNFDGVWEDFNTPIDAVEYADRLIYTQKGQYPKAHFNGNTYRLGISKATETILLSTVTPRSAIVYTKHGTAKTAKTVIIHIVFRKYGEFVSSPVTDETNYLPVELTTTNTTLDFPNLEGYSMSVYRLIDNRFILVATIGTEESLAVTLSYDDPAIAGKAVLSTTDIANFAVTEKTVEYVITRWSSLTGYESAPSAIKEFKVHADSHVRILLSGASTPSDEHFTHYRVYRRGYNSFLGTFSLVGSTERSSRVVVDTNLSVNSSDTLKTLQYDLPDPNMHSLVEAYGLFAGIVGNTFVWSEQGKPYAWPASNSLPLREDGTGTLITPQGVLIFTKHLTYLLSGTSLADFRLSLLTENQGCLTNKSCNLVRNSPVWVSNDGICTLTNGYVQVLSRPVLGRIKLDVKQTAVFDEQYYILEKQPDGATGSSILVLDLRSGLRFYRLESVLNLTDLHVHDGSLYASDGTYIYTIGTTNATLKYKSPQFIEGNHTDEKNYNKLYVRADGDFTVKLFLNNQVEPVLSQSISGDKTHELTPPSTNARGWACNLEITGVGTVYAIDTQPVGDRLGGLPN